MNKIPELNVWKAMGSGACSVVFLYQAAVELAGNIGTRAMLMQSQLEKLSEVTPEAVDKATEFVSNAVNISSMAEGLVYSAIAGGAAVNAYYEARAKK